MERKEEIIASEIVESDNPQHQALEQAKVEEKKGRADHIALWQFKPGVSGNPGGRPKGSKSLKEFAKEYLLSLPDEEKLEYMKGMDKRVIWEMSEGRAKQDVELAGSVSISHVLDSLENERQEIIEQGVENQPSIQNQEQTATISPVQEEPSATALQPEQVESQHNPEIAPTGIHNG